MLSRRARVVLFAAYLGGLLGLTAVAGEVIVRLNQWWPWTNPDPHVTVAPGQRLFDRDEHLGYRHLPGRFDVTLADGHRFHMTHLPSSLRATHPLETYTASTAKPEIWVLGCSFTHGWALDDEDTYPWVLQTKLPSYEVVNYGVSGYGTVHSLVQLEDALAHGQRPRAVVLAYASFHDPRNTFLRQRRKEVAPWNRLGPVQQPVAELAADGRLALTMSDVTYTELPLMRVSALANFVEVKLNKLEEGWVDSHRVSEALVDRMLDDARAAGFPLLVAGIWDDAPTHQLLEHVRQRGGWVVDVGLDPHDTSLTNQPHDSHPNARANQRYAEGIERALHQAGL